MNTKPLCLRLEEAENELNEAIVSVSSKHDLPCYLLEYIVSDLLTRVKNGKREEIARAKKSVEGYTGTINGAKFVNGICVGQA